MNFLEEEERDFFSGSEKTRDLLEGLMLLAHEDADARTI